MVLSRIAAATASHVPARRFVRGVALLAWLACLGAGPVAAGPVVVTVEESTATQDVDARTDSEAWDTPPSLPSTDLGDLLAGATRVGQDPALAELAQAGVPEEDDRGGRRAFRLQGSSIRDLARSMVNVAPGGVSAGSPLLFGGGAGAPPFAEDAAEAPGSAERSAAAEALAGLATTLLGPAMDEQGVVSFSFLGLGEFALMATADRHNLSLSYDDLILFNFGDAQAAAATQRIAYDGAWQPPGWVPTAHAGQRSANAGPTQFSFADLLLLFREIATYPPLLAGVLLVAVVWLAWKLARLARRPA